MDQRVQSFAGYAEVPYFVCKELCVLWHQQLSITWFLLHSMPGHNLLMPSRKCLFVRCHTAILVGFLKGSPYWQ